MILPRDFYLQEDVVQISQELLGKVLMTNIDGQITGGIITETEAYHGPEDRASHAYGGRKTKRNAVMYERGGLSYVYLCYGIHSLFNIITNVEGIPHAILIRAVQPLVGLPAMLERRGFDQETPTLCSGPGSLTKALGIRTIHSGVPLKGPLIWVEDRKIPIDKSRIMVGPRVGIDYAGEDALLPWRFRVKGAL